MAKVAREIKPRTKTDEFLDYLHDQWAGIPGVAAEWSDWDEHSRLVFSLDWPVCEDRLQQLQTWARQSLLNSAQLTRYERLVDLVSRYRPILDQLLNDDAA